MNTHAFQFGAPGPLGSQSSHRHYPSVDVVDEKIAAGLDVGRGDVIKVSVERFTIRPIDQSTHPAESERVKGSNLVRIRAAKGSDQRT